MALKKTLWADLLLLLVAVMWGGGFIAGKLSLEVLSPLWLIGFRFFFSGAILLCFSFMTLNPFLRTTIYKGMLLGALMFVGFCCQTVGLKYTDAGKQGFLISIYTVLVPFLSWGITKSKPTINHLLAAFITVIGIAFISLNRTLTISYGDGLTLAFAFLFALQIVLTGRYARECNVLHLTSTQMLTTGFLAFAGTLITRDPIPQNYFDQWPAILYMIFICTLTAFFLQNFAQAHTRDSHASIIIALEAVFGFIFALWLLDEHMTGQSLIGCVLIFIGVMVSKADTWKWGHFCKGKMDPTLMNRETL